MRHLELPEGFWDDRAAELASLQTQRNKCHLSAQAARVRYVRKRGGFRRRYNGTFCYLKFLQDDPSEFRFLRMIYARGCSKTRAVRNIILAIVELWWHNQKDPVLYLKRVSLPDEADVSIELNRDLSDPALRRPRQREEDLMPLLRTFAHTCSAFLEQGVPVSELQEQVQKVAGSIEKMDRALARDDHNMEAKRAYDARRTDR